MQPVHKTELTPLIKLETDFLIVNADTLLERICHSDEVCTLKTTIIHILKVFSRVKLYLLNLHVFDHLSALIKAYRHFHLAHVGVFQYSVFEVVFVPNHTFINKIVKLLGTMFTLKQRS